MSGYLFVLISSLSGAAKGYIGKTISNKTSQQKQAVFVNIVRMCMCIVISLVMTAAESGTLKFSVDKNAVIYGILSGITMSLFVVSWLLCVRNGAFMLVSIAQMFGTVLTIMLNFIIFKENISPKQITGIIFLIISVIIMTSYNIKLKGKMSVAAVVMLIICGASSGVNDFSQKLFTSFSACNISAYNLITYIVSAIFLLLWFICNKSEYEENKLNSKALFKETFIPVALMAVCLFLNTYFKALSTKYLTAAQIYPVYQALGLILSTSMSTLFFKEKLMPRSIVGVVLAFMALIFIN